MSFALLLPVLFCNFLIYQNKKKNQKHAKRKRGRTRGIRREKDRIRGGNERKRGSSMGVEGEKEATCML